MLDILIKGGLLFDGLGSPPKPLDVGICTGRVTLLEKNLVEPAREIIDATGLWVVPGFLDIHTHYDIEVELASGLTESVRHGVTTVVMGHCSLSLTVGNPSTLADIFLRVENIPKNLVQKWLKQAVSWKTPAEYFQHLNTLHLGPHIAPMLGHSALRAEVMGLERSLKERATDKDLEKIQALAKEALDAGCIGISVDMVPWHMMSGPFKGRTIPSQHADYREYKILADLCRKYDAVFQVTPNPQKSISFLHILLLSVGLFRRSPLRTMILTALDSVVDRRLWRIFTPLLFLANRILGGNARFQTLTEPFTIYSDGPLTPLFEEFGTGVDLNNAESSEERRHLWKNPTFRRQFRREWIHGKRRTFHRNLALMKIVQCPNSTLNESSFLDLARGKNQEPVELFMDMLETYDTDLRWVSTGANDRLLPRLFLMAQEFILPGFTDAGAHVRNLGYYDSALSLLKQAVVTGFLSPQQAIYRVTGEPAHWYRLDVGVLKVGARADLALLRPDALRKPISPQVEFLDPILDGALRMVKRDSDDIVHSVYVQGKRIWENGTATQILGKEKVGEILRLKSLDEDDAFFRRSSKNLGDRLRNRIDDETIDHPFEDYWNIFVLKHQNPWNVAIHCVGVITIYSAWTLALTFKNPYWLILLPFPQLVGAISHLVFEPSHINLRDAFFTWRVSRCLNKMFWRVLTGRYFDDVKKMRRQLEAYRQSIPRSCRM
jgi:N-acyl-D-aspartate/D-glutamate deacylase